MTVMTVGPMGMMEKLFRVSVGLVDHKTLYAVLPTAYSFLFENERTIFFRIILQSFYHCLIIATFLEPEILFCYFKKG